jgi:hypothetical protein
LPNPVLAVHEFAPSCWTSVQLQKNIATLEFGCDGEVQAMRS